jgi:hypothetical protein
MSLELRSGPVAVTVAPGAEHTARTRNTFPSYHSRLSGNAFSKTQMLSPPKTSDSSSQLSFDGNGSSVTASALR